MSSQPFSSWGRVARPDHETIDLKHRFAEFPALAAGRSVLPFGNGRSYGDSCLNVGGTLMPMRSLDRFIGFDRGTGVLSCESGLLLGDILRLTIRHGWFLPVVPGTQYVTVGGAIANDVHGKNHHRLGTFGRHVNRFELLRSDGRRLMCSTSDNRDWFSATIGGLGLTGVITWAELQLRRVSDALVESETIRYGNLDEFFALCAESDAQYEYTVSWLDCASKGAKLGRGLFTRGSHHAADGLVPATHGTRRRRWPLTPPFSLVNRATLNVFNACYYWKQRSRVKRTVQNYEAFFFPLDTILDWNRLYGPRGFYQYQCVVPNAVSRDATAALLSEIEKSGLGSFLAVLKLCGDVGSPGMLSFPLHGVSLALDFPNAGGPLHRLFSRLDAVIAEAGGRIYPAKDGRMPGTLFRRGYPRWEAFSAFVDPRFSSSFWRRVTEEA